MSKWSGVWFFSIGLSLAAFGCSDDEVDDGSGGSGGTGATAATGGTGATGGSSGASGSSGSSGSGGLDGGAGSGGNAGADGGDAAADAAPDANSHPFKAALSNVDYTVECKVDAGADQIDGSFDADYDNTANSSPVNGNLTVTISLISGANSMTWTHIPTPAATGPVAAAATKKVTHSPVTGTGSGTDDPCKYCGGTMSLKVDWKLDDDAGSVVSDVFGPVNVKCNQ